MAVEPIGSLIGPSREEQEDSQFFEVEGIGYDFTPTVLDKSLVDEWVKVNDKDSFLTAREIIRQEGLLCGFLDSPYELFKVISNPIFNFKGGSSGTAMFAALKCAKNLNSDQRVVVVLPDEFF